MIYRKILRHLEKMRQSNGKYALLIDGARQVGKTFSVREFAKANYDVFIEINFIKMKGAVEIFENVEDEKDILVKISALTKRKLERGRTLVFFDEVQKCPEAVTYIKFLVEEGSCHYVLSGSLLGVELKNIRSVPVGYMDEVKMYPLDFEEFVNANGEAPELLEEARRAWENRKPLSSVYHTRLKKLFRLYLVVGGMPAVVQRYLETHDISQVVAEQRKILALYRTDITQYDEKNALRIRAVFDRIPAELNDKNKRFFASAIQPGMRFENLGDEFLWLKEAGVALPVVNVEEPKLPLKLAEKPNLFKLFLNDVGLLAAQYMKGIQLRILNGEVDINFGSVYENVVAQELTAHGFELNYYDSNRHGELDFLLERECGLLPIEVKSGKHYRRHRALNRVMGEKESAVREALILNDDALKVEGRLYYAPVYMVMFLKSDPLPEKMIYTID
ncbi:MAG: ATP-binding protein [bacterium]|nr:ATP-binding protein [Candidatus Colisoma equi]